ncbi:uncharacterized protein PV09_09498 [Verruconis gallopava]|uniref:Mid2 domain-containing protein n=1 Tax=Verruconis gallopava TaxID=253628 RepID=A0A0D1YDD7_9PEZI|nr:uncharacterized protein PV09_09498 [Verruconis gallopava]KIV98746.1 hypothetical protein PV09_09498 [Verruconis gallopava]
MLPWHVVSVLLSLTSLSKPVACDPQVYSVNVGINGSGFDPNTTYADPGDIISFQLYSNNTVNRAEYVKASICDEWCNPCIPWELFHPGEAGFHSGHVHTFNITINDTAPIFLYSDAPSACANRARVGVINPNATFILKNQVGAAQAAPYQLSAGQMLPTDGGRPSNLSTSSSSALNPTATTASSRNSGHNNDAGKIVGISVGVLTGIAILFTSLLWYRKRRKEPRPEKQMQEQAPTLSYSYYSPTSDVTSPVVYYKIRGEVSGEVSGKAPSELRGDDVNELPGDSLAELPDQGTTVMSRKQ